ATCCSGPAACSLIKRLPSRDTHPAAVRQLPRCRCSVTGGVVQDNDQADDLAVTDAEVVRQNELVGQAGLVEGAVVGAADDRVAVVVQDLADVDADLVAHHLFSHPAADGGGPGELTPGVVHVGVRGERGHDRVGVQCVDGGDVLGDDASQLGGVHRV